MSAYSLKVQPYNAKRETLWFLAVIMTLLLGAGLYLVAKEKADPNASLLDWQTSAFHELEGADLAIYTALFSAGEEIFWIQYDIGRWPSIDDLQQLLMPPMYRDLSWQRNGELNWTLKDVVNEGEMQGRTIYHGSGGKIEGQGAFMLVMGHIHAGGEGMSNQATIWRHDDPNAPVPQASKPESFVLSGWKQVIPYSGEEEVKRLKGAS